LLEAGTRQPQPLSDPTEPSSIPASFLVELLLSVFDDVPALKLGPVAPLALLPPVVPAGVLPPEVAGLVCPPSPADPPIGTALPPPLP
jgi:hypothetical protein